MGYVKMPEMLSPELVKALAGNVHTVKEEQKHEDEMAAAWKEYLKPEKKCGRSEETAAQPAQRPDNDDICAPRKVKFIFVLNNAVVINVNAIAEEEDPCA